MEAEGTDTQAVDKGKNPNVDPLCKPSYYGAPGSGNWQVLAVDGI